MVQVQGEMDADGGQPEIRPVIDEVGREYVEVVVVFCVVCCVVVVMELQLVKSNKLRFAKEVTFEQVLPETSIKSWGLFRTSHAKSQRLAMQFIGS